MRNVIIFALALFPALSAPAKSVSIQVDPAAERRAITPYSYGVNNAVIRFAPLRRLGGNRMTGYNWENNASSAGIDWKQMNDFWLLTQIDKPLPDKPDQPSGAVVKEQAASIRAGGSEPLMTLQMAGYVSADGAGSVSKSESAPSKRWKPVLFQKPGAPASYQYPPNKMDDAVYMDELVAYFVKTFGPTPGGKIKFYALDNEPDLWSDGKGGGTHGQLHPAAVTYEELLTRSSALASAVLGVDPDAQIFAPMNYGFNGYNKLQDAPDYKKHNAKYGWFVAYYLDQMKLAGAKAGKRLLHYYTVHYYTEANGPGGRLALNGAGPRSKADSIARAQSTRSLWDPAYVEDSWIAKSALPNDEHALRLIPRLRAAIDQWYPGTGLAITEWSFGAEDHISGGLAASDALGIFGREGVVACAWPTGKLEYLEAAFKLYLNYDGKGAKFADTSVKASSSDIADLPVYAAADSKVPGRYTVVAINRNFDSAIDAEVTLALPAGQHIHTVNAWRLSDSGAKIEAVKAPAAQGAGFKDTLPKFTATLYEVRVMAGATK